MGRGDREDAGEETAAFFAPFDPDRAPQVSVMPWPGVPAYSVRARAVGTSHVLLIHPVQRMWAAADGRTFTHRPFETACPCGRGLACEAGAILRLAAVAGFRPTDAPVVRSYTFAEVAPGVVLGRALGAEEIPLMVLRLTPRIVLVGGARIWDTLVVDGTCSRCPSECAHLEAAASAPSAPALLRVADASAPGSVTACVEGLPEDAEAFIAIVDHDALAAAELASRADMEALAQEHTTFALEHIRKEKEAEGETFDPSLYERPAPADAPAAPEDTAEDTAWDTAPRTGNALVIATAVGGTVLDLPLGPDRACRCVPDCPHNDLLVRLTAALDAVPPSPSPAGQ